MSFTINATHFVCCVNCIFRALSLFVQNTNARIKYSVQPIELQYIHEENYNFACEIVCSTRLSIHLQALAGTILSEQFQMLQQITSRNATWIQSFIDCNANEIITTVYVLLCDCMNDYQQTQQYFDQFSERIKFSFFFFLKLVIYFFPMSSMLFSSIFPHSKIYTIVIVLLASAKVSIQFCILPIWNISHFEYYNKLVEKFVIKCNCILVFLDIRRSEWKF